MQRHSKALKKYFQEESSKLSIILICLLVATVVLQIVIQQNEFLRIKIQPIDSSWIFSRLVYSALTFVTLGALLYKLKFYKLLYETVWRLFWYKIYEKVKYIVRWVLIAFMYIKVVPYITNILNQTISIAYNALRYIAFISPWLWIGLMIFFIWVLIDTQKKRK